MKKIVVIVLSLISIHTFGQQDKLIPPEPNVATLGKYAVHPVNNYTGIPNINIPIYTITSGSLQAPINISYHSGGIRLDEESGRVGLGWALNAGGVITRTIGHKDDLSTFGRLNQNTKVVPDYPKNNDGYYYPQNGNILFPNSDCEFIINGALTEVPNTILGTQDKYDLVPDSFYYNFNGMSGSFLLDQYGNPFLTNKEPVKIEFDKGGPQSGGTITQPTFIITNANGDIFFFEESQTTWFDDSTNHYVSSWFLTKIKSATNDEIEFTYTRPNTQVKPLKVFHQSMTADNKYLNSAGLSPYTSPVLLSEINFNNGKVVFTYSEKDEREDIEGSFFLKKIDVFSKEGNVFNKIKGFDLSYSYFGEKFTIPTVNSFSIDQTGDYGKLVQNGRVDLNLRLKLNSITENNEKTHSFEYYGGENSTNNTIPNKTFMGKDYWGFYNGVRNRISFIPSGASIDADRTPHPDHAKLFTLNKIIYPTKGYTLFDHELHTFNGASSVIGGGEPTSTTTITKTATSNGNGESVVTFTNTGAISTQNVEIKMNHVVYNYPCIQPNATSDFPRNMQPSEMYVELTKPNGDVVYSDFVTGLDVDASDNCTAIVVSKNVPMGVFTGGEYKLKAYFDNRGGTLSGQSSISISYKTTINPDESTLYSKGGGLRIKAITNYDSDGTPILSKGFKYHYTDNNDKENSYGKLTSFPNYRVGRSARITIMGTQAVFAPPVIAQSSSTNSLSQEQGSYVTYGQVEQFNTDSSGNTNGKTVSKYYNENSYYNPSIQVTNTVKANDWYLFPPIKIPINGLMYEQTDYKANLNKSFTAIRKVEDTYTVNGHNSATFDYNDTFKNPNMMMGGIYEQEWVEIITGTGTSNAYDCKLQRFQFYPYYSNLTQRTASKQTIFDTNGENPIVNEQKFYYDNENHLQVTRTETIDSKRDVLETKVYYPDDIISTTSISEGGSLSSSEYAEISKLKAENLHRIATPIQTITKKNGNIVSIERNLFSSFNNIALPSENKTAKGPNNLESKISYLSYNTKGLPLEISRENSFHTSYIWGYNQEYPIAKIENATYTQISEALGITEAALNNYNETNLSLLNGLRNNPAMTNTMITTYTYDPLIGTTSITNPQGQTAYYRYDDMNRMQYALDQDQHVVQQVRYNYQGQQSDALGGVIIDTPGDGPKIPNQPATFTANTSGSGSANLYTWSVNGVQEQCGSGVSFTKTFTSEGTYEVKVLAYNTETKHRVSHTLSVIVKYPELTTPVVNANYTHIVKGTNVDFSASSIGGGTGNLRYEWYVNNVKQAGTATTYRYNPNTAGTYNVYFKVIDNESGKSVNSAIRKLYAYNPLSTPNVSASKAHIERGTTTTFTASNIGGGSGSRRYEWYVNNIKQSAIGTTYAYHFPTSGTYTIKFKVVDLTMQNANSKWGANTPVLKVYPKMVVSTSQSATSVSGSSASVSFNVTGISGGSGSRQITWRAFKTVSPSQTAGSGTGTQFSFSNFATGTHEYNIVATVKDNLTGKQVTRLMVVISSISDEDCPNCGPQH